MEQSSKPLERQRVSASDIRGGGGESALTSAWTNTIFDGMDLGGGINSVNKAIGNMATHRGDPSPLGFKNKRSHMSGVQHSGSSLCIQININIFA
jgi:hypothetical protein